MPGSSSAWLIAESDVCLELGLVFLRIVAARELLYAVCRRGSPDVGVVALSYNVIPAGHPHSHVLWVFVSPYAQSMVFWIKLTRVIGMLGAFGNMNLTSSNLLRRRQFSASHIHPAPLQLIVVSKG
jgi:hypothetical protein